ncbi:Acetyltransferase (GNAT) domain-containing protein [Rhodovulum sp. ES.010]|uniref:lipid II:glycine glycyltransferase FemX n=1 Tax=Rhodovulum sp. ES.010 TaxID=1882821 RepID=UPI000925CF8D|nr:GNAT family N-acetyltransferase [Rhodovulum sp. ES.010]SIO24089.1 Acetyltransferase (GNAT) domain-containing protein [Rhodovulum sp. ES.010]
MVSWIESACTVPPEAAALPMQQHPAYGAACRALGSAAVWLEARTGGQRIGTAQVLRRRWPLLGEFALLSRGPVFSPDLDPHRARAALIALMETLGRGHRGVLATPEPIAGQDPLAGAGLLRMVSPGQTALVDLAPPPDRLRAGLHQKWRNRLVRAEAAGLEVRESPLPADHWLLTTEAAQARARGYARLPPPFARAWARAGDTLLLEARADGRPVAAMLMLLHAPWASYHTGWSDSAGRRLNAHTLLLWRAMLGLRARGISTLDLGGLDTVSTPGLARFKLGSGARPRPLGATWMRAPGSGLVARLARAG